MYIFICDFHLSKKKLIYRTKINLKYIFMKWIKNRAYFLAENDKLKDILLDPQKAAVIQVWGEKFLDLKKIEATPNIKQVTEVLSEEDKMKAFSIFFSADLKKVYDFFGSLPQKFIQIINDSVDLSMLKEPKHLRIMNEFNIGKPTINQISALSESVFKKISVSETKADEIIVRDETGRPKLGEDNRPLKMSKEKGAIIYSRNLTNINGMVEDYNNLYPDNKVDSFKFSSGEVLKVIDSSKSDFGGDNYLVEVDVFAQDLKIRIDHNPVDILNMSVSRFYGSCQHLYRGGYRESLLANVFDPNSIPAFLVFDSPITDRNGVLLSEKLFLSRMMIRNIYSYDTTQEPKIFFDRAYPDRMKDFFDEMVEKYTGNKQTTDSRQTYLFTPDIPDDYEIRSPYMDRLAVDRKKFIGINSNQVTFQSMDNWSSFIISPKAKITEINIETTLLPDNFFELKLNPELIRIKYIKIKDLSIFQKIQSEKWSFEKCKISKEAIDGFTSTQKEVKSLQFINSDIAGFNLANFQNLQELELLWISNFDLKSTITSLNPKRGFVLTVTSDSVNNRDNKEFINSLKSRGVIVKIYEEELAKKRRQERKK